MVHSNGNSRAVGLDIAVGQRPLEGPVGTTLLIIGQLSGNDKHGLFPPGMKN